MNRKTLKEEEWRRATEEQHQQHGAKCNVDQIKRVPTIRNANEYKRCANENTTSYNLFSISGKLAAAQQVQT